MDEKTLQDAVLEQLPDELARCIAKTEGIHFDEILTLNLEYREIVRIRPLVEFTSLTRLELNINLIEKIDGLDHMVNLTWLNLSFNRIERIEGLECLHKLEVLNLTKNKISVIENMNALEKLTHFSIADNLLGQRDNVLYLKRFTNLFSLNLCGNDITKDDGYKPFMAAQFQKLTFLDNRLLDKEKDKETSIKCKSDLEELKLEALMMKEATKAKGEAEIKLHTDAFVEFLNGSHLFESMLEDDSLELRNCVPGVASLLEKFEHQMVELCNQIFDLGLVELGHRETEVSLFLSGKKEAVTDCQQTVSQILEEFDDQHREGMVELQQLSQPWLVGGKKITLNKEIDQLCERLMALRFQLVCQLKGITEIFDIDLSDMDDNFIEIVQKIFAQCRDLEKEYHKKIQEIIEVTLEKAGEGDIPDDVHMLIKNEAQVKEAANTAHENHEEKIRARETQLVTRVNAWKTSLIEGIKDITIKLDHNYMVDIFTYVDHLKEQLKKSCNQV